MDAAQVAVTMGGLLLMAAQRQRPAKGLITHSDRGSQYAAGSYRGSTLLPHARGGSLPRGVPEQQRRS